MTSLIYNAYEKLGRDFRREKRKVKQLVWSYSDTFLSQEAKQTLDYFLTHLSIDRTSRKFRRSHHTIQAWLNHADINDKIEGLRVMKKQVEKKVALAQAIRLRREGMSLEQIAKIMKKDHKTIKRILEKYLQKTEGQRKLERDNKIIRLILLGHSQSEVARKTKVNQSTVSRIWRKYKQRDAQKVQAGSGN